MNGFDWKANDSFVNATQPPAPIKTAIIRPTSYYEVQRRAGDSSRSSAFEGDRLTANGGSVGGLIEAAGGSQEASKRLCGKPHDCQAELLVVPVNDWLSDSALIKYGTNATARQRSKVEAWIESSSSATSEMPLHALVSESDMISSTAARLENSHFIRSRESPDITDSNYVGSDDLSIDQLCEELLALSASCSTLEKMLSDSQWRSPTALPLDEQTKPLKLGVEPKCFPMGDNLSSKPTSLSTEGQPTSSASAPTDGYKMKTHPGGSCNKRIRGGAAQPDLKCKLPALFIDTGVSYPNLPCHNLHRSDTLITIAKRDACVMTRSVSRHLELSSRTAQMDCLLSPSTQNVTVNPKTKVQPNKHTQVSPLKVSLSAPNLIVGTFPKNLDQSFCSAQVNLDVDKPTLTSSAIDGILPRSQIKQFTRTLSDPCAGLSTLLPERRSSLTIKSPSKRRSKANILRTGLDFIRHSNSHKDQQSKSKEANLQGSSQFSNDVLVEEEPETTPTPNSGFILNTLNYKHTAPLAHSTLASSMHPDIWKPESSSLLDNLAPNAIGKSVDTELAKVKVESSQHETLSSSFESEAMDMLASLRLRHGLRAVQKQNCKLPTSPMGASPLLVVTGADTESPHSPFANGGVAQSRTPISHSQAPIIRCPSRRPGSYYDNVVQTSPFGHRGSATSAGSTGTVFSRPWDLSHWEECFTTQVDLRINGDSIINDGIDGVIACPSPARSSHSVSNLSHTKLAPFNSNHGKTSALSFSNTKPVKPSSVNSFPAVLSSAHNLQKLIKICDQSTNLRQFPTALPDVTLVAADLTANHSWIPWDKALERLLTRLRTIGKMFGEPSQCEVTRYASQLFSDSRSLPGALFSTFLMCTLETRNKSKKSTTVMLSNTRQFMDGMKRYMLHQPDTRMMFAVQRERRKLASDRFLDLDAVLEASLQSRLLKPLSDHLLGAITEQAEYSLQSIAQTEMGLKMVANSSKELFTDLLPVMDIIQQEESMLVACYTAIKSEFSPLAKLKHLVEASLLVFKALAASSCSILDVISAFLYTLAQYGDGSLAVHLVYIRELLPQAVKTSTTFYLLNIYHICMQVCGRMIRAPAFLQSKATILRELIQKACSHVVLADDATCSTSSLLMPLSDASTASELIEILVHETGNPDLISHTVCVVADDKESLLKPSDHVLKTLQSLHVPTSGDAFLMVRSSSSRPLLIPNYH